jgi:hypothetical protein
MDVGARLPSGGVESLERVIASERARARCGTKAIEVVDGSTVVAAGKRKAQHVSDGDGISGINAAGMDAAGKIHACVIRFAVCVATRDPVSKRSHSGHAAVGIEIAEFRVLIKADIIAIVGGPGGELIAVSPGRSVPGHLAGRAEIALLRAAAIQ